ncbi:MAG: glycosyltransferase family 4 protein [Acidobacteriota bacterium]
MRILMIAPEPFFEPRGTPFSEYHRIRALTDLGHTVDLVTYPFGRHVTLPGLRVFRSAKPPFVERVKIGPSWAKVPLDVLLALRAFGLAWRGAYDLIHSHEEGAAIGLALARWLGVPHLYDMHSSLPEQLSNFSFSRSRALVGAFRWLERRVVTRSQAVIVICRHLEDTVRRIRADAPVVLIENAPGAGDAGPQVRENRVRAQHGLTPDDRVVLYTGTFEAYQGLSLLLDAMRIVSDRVPRARLLLVGGHADQIDRLRRDAERAGVAGVTVFAGEQPAGLIPAYLQAADVLVSPRSRGTNTPLKIYQYLRAGRPIVATDLLTHTQVLDPTVAVLASVTPEAFADGVVRVLTDAELAASLSRRAAELAATKYTYEAYVDRTRQALALVGAGTPTSERAA